MRRFKLFLLGVTGIAVVGGGLWSTYTILKWNKGFQDLIHYAERKADEERKKAEEEKRAIASKPEFTYAYEMKGLTFSLTNKKGNRMAYGQLTLQFDCPEPTCVKNLEMHRALVLDSLNQTARAYPVEAMQGPGLADFKATLLKHLNDRLENSKPRQVVVRDLLIQ